MLFSSWERVRVFNLDRKVDIIELSGNVCE